MKNLIFNLLSNRELYLDLMGNGIVGPRNVTVGLEQGFPLSPLLFNTLEMSIIFLKEMSKSFNMRMTLLYMQVGPIYPILSGK